MRHRTDATIVSVTLQSWGPGARIPQVPKTGPPYQEQTVARDRLAQARGPRGVDGSKYPPAKPGALVSEPLKAAGRSRWTSAVNVKLLLPPRQCRVTSLGRLASFSAIPANFSINPSRMSRASFLPSELFARTRRFNSLSQSASRPCECDGPYCSSMAW
jgi:hypothetical protein